MHNPLSKNPLVPGVSYSMLFWPMFGCHGKNFQVEEIDATSCVKMLNHYIFDQFEQHIMSNLS
jgi:hypothetical protein